MNKKKTAVASHNGDNGRGTPIKVPEKTYQLTPEGFHPARCTLVADVGTHRYNHDGKKQPKLVITFELPTLLTVFDEERGPEPPHQSIICTNSLGERSKLYKTIVSWLGKGAIDRLRDDLGLLVGEPCMLNLIRETSPAGTTRCKIIDVTRVPKGTEVPAQISPSLRYSIADGVAGGTYDKLPAWIQKMILDSEEIDGPHPSKTEIAERNVRQATANATEPISRSVRGRDLDDPSGIDQTNAELQAEADEYADELTADVDALTR
jgi:hypothetical protein